MNDNKVYIENDSKNIECNKLRELLNELKNINEARRIELAVETVFSGLGITLSTMIVDANSPAFLLTLAETVAMLGIAFDTLIKEEEVRNIVNREEECLDGSLKIPEYLKK